MTGHKCCAAREAGDDAPPALDRPKDPIAALEQCLGACWMHGTAPSTSCVALHIAAACPSDGDLGGKRLALPSVAALQTFWLRPLRVRRLPRSRPSSSPEQGGVVAGVKKERALTRASTRDIVGGVIGASGPHLVCLTASCPMLTCEPIGEFPSSLSQLGGSTAFGQSCLCDRCLALRTPLLRPSSGSGVMTATPGPHWEVRRHGVWQVALAAPLGAHPHAARAAQVKIIDFGMATLQRKTRNEAPSSADRDHVPIWRARRSRRTMARGFNRKGS